jgi:hypothetical protein
VFFFVPNDGNIDNLKGMGAPYYLVARTGSKSVYSNRPVAAGAPK